MQHIGIIAFFGVIPVRCILHVIDKGIVGFSRGVHSSVQDFTQCRKAHIAGTGSPDDAFNLLIFLSKAELKSVSSVVNHNNIVEIGADEIDHGFLGVVELEVMGTFIPVRVVFGVVSVNLALCHILGNIVMAFTRKAGNHDDSCIGKGFCVGDQFIAVILYRSFGEVPVLSGDGNRCAAFRITEIEVDQLLVDFKTGFFNAVNQAYLFIKVIDAAGTGTAVNRVGRCPAEEIELFCVLQGQDAFIFQKNKALFRNLQCIGRGFCSEFRGNNCGCRLAADEVQQSCHRAGADQVDHDDDGKKCCEPGFTADEFLFRFGKLLNRNRNSDGCNKSNSYGNKVRREALQYANQIFHFKRDHGESSFLYSSGHFPVLWINSIRKGETTPIHISAFTKVIDKFRKSVYNYYENNSVKPYL